ncbi:cyclophilin-like domain-containing protein [Protomyces lactucae-debilis]|uniref:Peptidyl-prolyl cis-trans isomerase n=1 Tax=Protomyces lactucae-debilis TaxID=2754530 RepID=A0A1Y2F1Z1_PROLT|nr:cyclophilin-like domain-containing protein [Protomyces lactucae-debilis]ORY77717.1 cyclophilin-like domain-containing protein [Protomyces lactucae-debilis]
MSVLLETSAGDLVIDLLVDEAPKCCLNFLKLCKLKYFNFAPVYNLQAPAFFQAGDPLYPAGDGGSSVWGLADTEKRFFKPEILSAHKHRRGTISMAVLPTGLAGSQFFISLGPNDSFDKKHAIFGHLAEGEETLDKIAAQPVDNVFRPLRDIRIQHSIILEDPFDDPPEMPPVPDQSPAPSHAQLATVRIAFDEQVEDESTLDPDTLDKRRRAREAEAAALALETMGDLPSAHIRPPENILFVCKLNPITVADDLELIFGRFGTILSCQVVRDARTGDSLQYAFIEYDKKEDAERAYFKMQGVLIDDRRIHVDFSQSVAKTRQAMGGQGGGRRDMSPAERRRSPRRRDDTREDRRRSSSRDRRSHRDGHAHRRRSPSPRRHRESHRSDRSRHDERRTYDRGKHDSRSQREKRRSRTPERRR